MTYSLAELTTFIRRVFALNLPEAVWVTAELAQVNESRGHHWLTLTQQGEVDNNIVAQLEGVVWQRQLAKIKKIHGSKLIGELLRTGMSVRLRVTISFHERYGLRLVVEDIDPAFTIGELERQRQRTYENLEKEGLLDLNAKTTLSDIPLRLAVISSETAAGLADFSEHLERNAYGYAFRVHTYAAAMQGAQTTLEVTRRLRQIERRKKEYDAVVIVRGGGGRTDLAAFDEETLARAIAKFPLPVLTGIGHEIDSSIADRVAHTALKTPTAVATFLIDRVLRAEGRLLQIGRAIVEATGVQREQLRLARIEQELPVLYRNALNSAKQQLRHHEQLLEALRPDTTLARGYALVSQGGKLVTEPGEVREGALVLRLRGGKKRVEVREDTGGATR